MKKLYFLNEEEKQRILRLHRNRKNQLDEQTWFETGTNTLGTTAAYAGGGALAGAATGAAIGAIGGPVGIGVGATIGAIGAGIYGLVSNISSTMDRSTFIKTVETACATTRDLGKPALDAEKINGIAEKINDYITINQRYFDRYMSDAQIEGLKELFNSIPTLPDFCIIAGQYQQMYGKPLMEALSTDIYMDSAFARGVRAPIQKAINKSMDLSKKGAEKTDDKDGTKTGGESDWEKTQLEFYKSYPCLADIGIASRAKNAIVVQNPSEHQNIIDQSQGTKTRIIDRTTFMLDGTYITATDAKRNARSGKFMCDPGGELTLLYAGDIGTGEEGGIFKQYPCLGREVKSNGEHYTKLDKSDNNQAIMYDEDRKEHPIFKTYPEGDVFFMSDGTFLLEKDSDDLDSSGTFRCNKLNTKVKAKLNNVTPTPGTEEKKSSSGGGGGGVIPPIIGGMGTVMSSVQGEIAEILKCANITGTVLNQSNLNQLYQFIKNNKK